MERPPIILADMTQYGSDGMLHRQLEQRYTLHLVNEGERLGERVRRVIPYVICFEYDFPDIPRLTRLSRTKREFPSIPIVMLTEEHSEALAVWALRSRVWDYFVKPVAGGEVLECLDMLYRMSGKDGQGRMRDLILPPLSLPPETRFTDTDETVRTANAAAKFIEENLAHKLSQADVAAHCGVSNYQLNRCMRRAFSMTFQEFVARRRMSSAERMLKNRSASVTDVSWAVGYRDLSYFTRVFRRYVGTTPSTYRQRWLALQRPDGGAK